MNRKVFLHIDTVYELDKILKGSGIEADSADGRELRSALALIEQYIRPRAVIKRCILEERDGVLYLNGIEQREGPMERKLRLLTTRKEIALGVITAGDEIDYIGNVTSKRVFNALKFATLTGSVQYISSYLKESWGYRQVGWLSPGLQEELPIGENVRLFRLIGNVFEDIGVELIHDNLMKPDFTVSTVFYELKQP